MKEKTTETINILSEKKLKHYFEQGKIPVERCIDSGGKYIERDDVKVEMEKNYKCYTIFIYIYYIIYIFVIPRMPSMCIVASSKI